MQQTVPIATAIATRDETGFEGSESVSTFADEISENRLHLSNSSELDCIRFALSLQCRKDESPEDKRSLTYWNNGHTRKAEEDIKH